MLYKDTAELVSVTSTRDADGYPVNTETKTEVYVDIKSATRSEFYQALRSGIEATIVFIVFTGDYTGQKYVDCNGKRYRVVREYNKGDRTELNCREVKSHESE